MRRHRSGILLAAIALVLVGLVAGLGASPLPAATVDTSVADAAALSPGETPTVKPRLRFNLLPRSMQARPCLYCNVMTEFTKEGRKRAPKDRTQPQYYVFQQGGYLQKGDGAPARVYCIEGM